LQNAFFQAVLFSDKMVLSPLFVATSKEFSNFVDFAVCQKKTSMHEEGNK
jgi:hypothetical protein